MSKDGRVGEIDFQLNGIANLDIFGGVLWGEHLVESVFLQASIF